LIQRANGRQNEPTAVLTVKERLCSDKARNR
jgi:hypothetical protein